MHPPHLVTPQIRYRILVLQPCITGIPDVPFETEIVKLNVPTVEIFQ